MDLLRVSEYKNNDLKTTQSKSQPKFQLSSSEVFCLNKWLCSVLAYIGEGV